MIFSKAFGELLARNKSEEILERPPGRNRGPACRRAGEKAHRRHDARLASIPGCRWPEVSPIHCSCPSGLPSLWLLDLLLTRHTLCLFHSLSLVLPSLWSLSTTSTALLPASIQMLLDKMSFLSSGHLAPPLTKVPPYLFPVCSVLILCLSAHYLQSTVLCNCHFCRDASTSLMARTFLLPLGLFAGMLPAKSENVLYFQGRNNL